MLYLPERIAAMHLVTGRVQDPGFGKRGKIGLRRRWHAPGKLLDQCERPYGTDPLDLGRNGCTEAAHVAKAKPEQPGAVLLALQNAVSVGTENIDRLDAQSVPLGVRNQHRSRVKTHRLVVEDGRGEHGQVVELELRRHIGDQRDAGGVRLREAVQGEGADR